MTNKQQKTNQVVVYFTMNYMNLQLLRMFATLLRNNKLFKRLL